MKIGLTSFFDTLLSYLKTIPMVSIFIIVAVSIAIVFLYIIVVFFLAMKQETVSQVSAKARIRAMKRKQYLTKVYQMASKIPGIKSYLVLVQQNYRYLCPYDDAYLMKLVAETIVIVFLCSVEGTLAVISMNLLVEEKISFYSLACVLLLIYVISVETLHIRWSNKEKKVIEELIHYFATVKHIYYATNKIPQAVIEASDGMCYEVKLHAMQVYDILTGIERKTKVREYVLSPLTNKYMRMFLSQVYEVSERGDTIEEGSNTSLFAKNLEFLRMEMMREQCRKEKLEFKMQGYSLVALLPVFFMMPLRTWGLDFEPTMYTFYQGIGYMVMLLSFVTTLFVYDSINKVKELNGNRTKQQFLLVEKAMKKNTMKRYMQLIEKKKSPFWNHIRNMLVYTNTNSTLGGFLLSMMCYAMSAVLIFVVFFCMLHLQKRETLWTTIDSIDSIVYVATEKQKQVIIQHILDMTKKYCFEETISQEILREDFKQRMYLPNEEAISSICMEVERRVLEYKGTYFRWYEFVFCLFFGVIAGAIPYMGLRYQYGLVLESRREEVCQFQSIIMMERSFQEVTIPQLLEELENFAVLFRNSIRICLNQYSSGPQKALLQLKEREKNFCEFTELVDGFLAVETVGISVAFAEVQNNREMAENRRILSEEISLEKKVDYTDMLVFLPSCVVLGGYLLLPFFIKVAGSLFEVFDLLDSLAL